MSDPENNWSVEFKPAGRDGYLFYHEDGRELPFYWEYGGGDVVLIVRILEPEKFHLKFPWAIERKSQIFANVAGGLLTRAPGCTAEIEDAECCIYIRESNQPAISG